MLMLLNQLCLQNKHRLQNSSGDFRMSHLSLHWCQWKKTVNFLYVFLIYAEISCRQ